jgi:hypothetical protein
MKLSFDFSKLKEIAEKIGADESDFQLDDIKPFEPIAIKLGTTGIYTWKFKMQFLCYLAFENYHLFLCIYILNFKIRVFYL